MGLHLKPWQVDRYVDEYDVDKSGKVEFEEFMAMMITLQSKKPRADSINYKVRAYALMHFVVIFASNVVLSFGKHDE